jgi:anti-sigma B factor antagonist
MFEIKPSDDGRILLFGRLDASQAEKARAVLLTLTESCTLDFGALEYISSAGLGVLLETQKRLSESGHGLTLASPTEHIRDLFRIAGLDTVFEIK